MSRRRTGGRCGDSPLALLAGHAHEQPIIVPPAWLEQRRRAMLIKRVYHSDPLLCPRCGGTMKIIAFIEPRQGDVIRKILQHCGLWEDPMPRPPPEPPQKRPGPSFPLFYAAVAEAPAEIDPDFLEHLRYENLPEPEPPWDD